MSKPSTPPTITCRQIVDEKGNPYKAFITEGLWVGTNNETFSGYSKGNKVIPLTTGKKYYEELIKAINGAKETIYINGWQVSWDALLSPGDAKPFRLYELLRNAVKNQPKLHVYVLLWNDTDPSQTYEDQTKAVLLMIPGGRIQVRLQNASVDEAIWQIFTHHQKQVVVDRKVAFVGGFDLSYGRYDDDTYGLQADGQNRKALNRYNPCIPPVGTIPENEVIDPDHLTGTWDSLWEWFTSGIGEQINGGAHQIPYGPGNPINPSSAASIEVNHKTLHPQRQPRMPWQDVEVQVEGPAVSDLALNFVLRWNAEVYNDPFNLRGPNGAILWDRKGAAVKKEGLPLPPKAAKDAPKVGSCTLQVLRSASKTLRNEEHIALKALENLSAEDKDRFSKINKAQDDIHISMINLIYKAEHFIYIENQFFVSKFGEPMIGDQMYPDNKNLPNFVGPGAQVYAFGSSGAFTSKAMPGNSTALPKNEICEALGNRIRNTILDLKPRPFHVYITLPVHTEISLDSGMCITQVHWTMQTLVFGTHSLLNRIRRALKAREMMDKGEILYDANGKALTNLQMIDEVTKNPYNRRYEEIPLKKCFDYVTLLNLRNWDKLGNGRYVTEQVYIHSKCMIVDDLYVLVGSANINDRSLLGTRDSELAVLIVDAAHERLDICGNKKPQEVRQLAQTLRKAIWRKIFGMTGGERSAESELKTAIDEPANPKSWEKIQAVAQRNTELYEAAFKFIPRNKPAYGIDDEVRAELAEKGKKPRTSASIWPIWNYHVKAEGKETKEEKQKRETNGMAQGFMPFHTEFWVESHPQAAQAHREAAKEHDKAAQAHLETAKAHDQVAVDLNKTLAFEQTIQPFNPNRADTKAVRDSRAKLATQQKDNAKASLEARKTTLACEKPSQDAKKRTVEVAKILPTVISLQDIDDSLGAIKDIADPVAPSGWVRFHLQAAIKHRDAAVSHVNVAKEHIQAAENHDFTHDPAGQAAAAQLTTQVKGYITLLPIHWTEGENNNMGYHTAAITKNEANPQTEMMAHAEQGPGEKSA